MFTPFTGVKDIKFDHTTLVVSSMGIGDIGNLAIDLLSLNNQDIVKIGYYKSKFMKSIVANMDIINYVQSLALPAEIFQSKNFTFLQFRGRVRTGRKKEFLTELAEFFKKSQFKEIIVLSGSEGTNMPTISKEGTQVFVNAHKNHGDSLDLTKFLSSQELAKVMDTSEKLDEVLFGTGLGRAFYKAEELFKDFKITTLFIQTQTPQFDITRALILLRDFIGSFKNPPAEIKKLEFKTEEVLQQKSYKLPPFFEQQV